MEPVTERRWLLRNELPDLAALIEFATEFQLTQLVTRVLERLLDPRQVRLGRVRLVPGDEEERDGDYQEYEYRNEGQVAHSAFVLSHAAILRP